MNCLEFEARLEDLSAGRLRGAAQRSCEAHLASCSNCRQLYELAALDRNTSDLVETVLAHTSGPACASAQELLCAWVDRELARSQSELVAGHVETCDECRSLSLALAELARDLPSLAEFEPDAELTASILAATLPQATPETRPVWAASDHRKPAGLTEWVRVWAGQIRRPRLATELAYLATAFALILVMTPGSVLQAMPRQVLELARADALERLERPLVEGLGAFDTAENAANLVEALGAAGRVAEEVPDAATWGVEKFRTFWQDAASLLGNADDEKPSEEHETDEETT